MMEILIETTLNDLYILLFKKFTVVDKILIANLREKSDNLPLLFEKLLVKNKLKVSDIESFYVTNGPGSFMGIRAGLLFSQTLASALNKKVYICDSLHFLQTSDNKKVFIDAKGGFFYTLNNNKPHLAKGHFVETKPNYSFIENNLEKVLAYFQEANVYDDNALYIKKPRIG